MADHSNIQWTDATWNPIVGCDKVSAGCTNCYAIQTAYRLEHAFKQPAYQGTTRKLLDGSVNWTGTVRCLPDRLGIPLRWKKPARIFVNSMSDLFHEDVPDEFIERVFGVMQLARRHTFQVLTKRPLRMIDFLQRVPAHTSNDEPLPNVWLGVSVEDQRAVDERIPLLRQTPASIRWLSCEPLLGPINLWNKGQFGGNVLNRNPDNPARDRCVDWVVAGGESGPKARPMNPDWARGLRDQCQAANVPFFFKQVGGRTHAAGGRLLDGRTHDEYPEPRRELVHAEGKLDWQGGARCK